MGHSLQSIGRKVPHVQQTQSVHRSARQALRIWAWDGDSISNLRVLGPSEAHGCVPEKVQRYRDEIQCTQP